MVSAAKLWVIGRIEFVSESAWETGILAINLSHPLSFNYIGLTTSNSLFFQSTSCYRYPPFDFDVVIHQSSLRFICMFLFSLFFPFHSLMIVIWVFFSVLLHRHWTSYTSPLDFCLLNSISWLLHRGRDYFQVIFIAAYVHLLVVLPLPTASSLFFFVYACWTIWYHNPHSESCRNKIKRIVIKNYHKVMVCYFDMIVMANKLNHYSDWSFAHVRTSVDVCWVNPQKS